MPEDAIVHIMRIKIVLQIMLELMLIKLVVVLLRVSNLKIKKSAIHNNMEADFLLYINIKNHIVL